MTEEMLSQDGAAATGSRKKQATLSFGGPGRTLTTTPPVSLAQVNEALTRVIVCSGYGHAFVENPLVWRRARLMRGCSSWQFPAAKDMSRVHIPADYKAGNNV